MLYSIPLVRTQQARVPMEADSLEQAVEAVEALINDGELPEDLEWTDAEDEIDHPTIDNGF